MDLDFDRTIERESISIEERMDGIIVQLQGRKGIFFKDLFKTVNSRSVLIITFLALLELIRTRKVIFEQTDILGDIWLSHHVEIKPES